MTRGVVLLNENRWRPADTGNAISHVTARAATATALERGAQERARALVMASIVEPAARCDMRELVVRAHVHRYRFGDRTALASARLLNDA